MGENMFFYDHTTERLLRDRPSTSSSDSDDFGLVIDLGMNHCKTTASNHSKKEYNNDEYEGDDALSIGCEENETSVNFFIKVEKPGEKPNPNKKVAISKSTSTITSNPYQNKSVVSRLEKLQSGNKCNKCKFEATTINDLITHFTNFHQKEKFKCGECPYENESHACVKEHMKSHNINFVPYKCKCCTFVTNEKAHFTEHRSLHVKMKKKKEAKFQCPVCSYTRGFVSTLNHFKTHAKEHKDLKNILICPVCDMKVKNFGKHARHHIKLKFRDTEWWKEAKDESKKKSNNGDDTLEKKNTDGDKTLEMKSGDGALETKSVDGDGALEIDMNYIEDDDTEMASKCADLG